MADTDFEQFLSKLTFTPIDGKDVLGMFINSQENEKFLSGFRDEVAKPLLSSLKSFYLGDVLGAMRSQPASSLADPMGLIEISKSGVYKSTIKEVIINPVIDKLEKLYAEVEKGIDKNAKENVEALADPTGILEIRRDHKKNLQEVLDKNLGSLNRENVETAQENVEEKPLALTEKVKVVDKSSEETEKVKSSDKQTSGGEQKSFSDETTVTLSKKTMDSFSLIGLTMLKGFPEILKKLKIGKGEDGYDEKGFQKSMDDSSWLGNLLMGIGKVLLIGGAALTLGAMFWSDHIKPWLEKKLGTSLDFMDKFKGMVEGLGKWMVLGGVGASGFGLKILGMVHTSIGSFMEKTIEKGFSSLLGKEAAEGALAGGVKMASGASLQKFIGKIFGGLSKKMLSAIPIIGSLFSFWFAYDSFSTGDTIGGFINIASGLANLLNLVVPGLGTGLSLGIDILGGILDFKAGDGTTEEKQARKFDIMKGWLVGLEKIPFIGGLLKFGRGIYEMASGNWRVGLNLLTDQPFLGPIPGFLLALTDAFVENPDGSTAFSFEAFSKELKNNMFRFIISMVPNFAGMRGSIARWMGLSYDDKTGDIKVSDEPLDLESPEQAEATKAQNESIRKNNAEKFKPIDTSPENEKNLVAEHQQSRERREILEKNYELESGRWFFHNQEKADNFKALMDEETARMEKISEALSKNVENKSKSENVKTLNDGFIPSDNIGKSVYDPSTNTKYSLAPDDNILAYKSDGVFDKTLNEIKNVIIGMAKNIAQLQGNSSSEPSIVNTTNVSSSSNSSGDSVMSGKRDPIFDHRMDYWRKNPQERVFI